MNSRPHATKDPKPARGRLRRLVGTVDVCGLAFKVFIANEKGCPELKGLDGFCFGRRCQIFVRGDDETPIAYRREILRHELFHAVFYHAGAEDICSGSVPKAVEEAMVLSMVPHLSRAWDSAGRLDLR